MKILFLDYCVDVMGGVERVINCLATEFARDNEVEVVSEYRLVDGSFFKYGDNIKKTYLYDRRKDFTRNGVGVFTGKVFRKLGNAFYRIGEKRRLEKVIAKHQDIDVVIFGRVFMALRFLSVFAKMGKRPRIIVRDAIHLFDFKDGQKRQLKELFPKYVDDFIVSSDESAEAYRKFFGKTSLKIQKIYNPLGIKPRGVWSIENKTIVSAGRMDDGQKGFDVLIKAFVLTHKKHRDWKLRLYGDGAEKSKLVQLVKELGVSEVVEFCSAKRDALEVFEGASMFVLASRYEGYANALVEALACGIPAVTFDWLMGADEIVKNGQNGVIVELSDRKAYARGNYAEADYERLSTAMNYLIENPDVMKKFSDEGVKIAKQRAANVITKQWEEIIGERK